MSAGPWLDILTALGWLGSITGAALVVTYGTFTITTESLTTMLDSLTSWAVWCVGALHMPYIRHTPVIPAPYTAPNPCHTRAIHRAQRGRR